MANISNKEKEKLLSNKWLQSFAKELNIVCTCSNCRLYNRGNRRCKFDDSIIDNPNILDAYCEWWVPMKWILEKYKTKYPLQIWRIDWIENVEHLRLRKEYIKKLERKNDPVELSDKPVAVDNQFFRSNTLSEAEQYCNNQTKNNSGDDKKEQEIPESFRKFQTYINLLFNHLA